jgi:hypothetical protein
MRVAVCRRAEAVRASREFGVPTSISEEVRVGAGGTMLLLQFELKNESSLPRLTDFVERTLGGHVETCPGAPPCPSDGPHAGGCEQPSEFADSESDDVRSRVS